MKKKREDLKGEVLANIFDIVERFSKDNNGAIATVSLHNARNLGGCCLRLTYDPYPCEECEADEKGPRG